MNKQEINDLIPCNYSIHNLTEDEIANPHLAIQGFFSYAHLPEVRDMLWLFLKSNITGSFTYEGVLTLQERYDLVLLYEQIVKLVEAAHLINEKRILEAIISQ